MFISFIISIVLMRLFNYFFPGPHLEIQNVHIHHFVYGIILMSFVGILALNNIFLKHLKLLNILFGIGLAFLMDEFGMWIPFNDNYWAPLSYSGIVITALILMVVSILLKWRHKHL